MEIAWLKRDKVSYKGTVYGRRGDKVTIVTKTEEGLAVVEQMTSDKKRFWIKLDELSSTKVNKLA